MKRGGFNKPSLKRHALTDAGIARRNRVKSRIFGVFFYSLLAALVLVVFFSEYSSGAGAPKNFFGYSAMRVLSPSMQRDLPQGSLVVTQYTVPGNLQIGDNISIFRLDGSSVTHRIITIYENYENSGKRGFETKGIENPKPDPQIVYADNVIGRVIFNNLLIGQAMTFVRLNLIAVAAMGVLFIGLLAAFRMIFTTPYGDQPRSDFLVNDSPLVGFRPHSGHVNTIQDKGG